MSTYEAYIYWLTKLNRASSFSDPHWDAEERHEHQDYIEALQKAVEMFDLVMTNDETRLKAGYEKYKILERDFLRSLREKEIQRASKAMQKIKKWESK